MKVSLNSEIVRNFHFFLEIMEHVKMRSLELKNNFTTKISFYFKTLSRWYIDATGSRKSGEGAEVEPWSKDKHARRHLKESIALCLLVEFKLVTCSVWHKPPFGSQRCEQPNIQFFFLPWNFFILKSWTPIEIQLAKVRVIIIPLLTSLRLSRELNSPSSTLIKCAFSWLCKHVKFIILISRGRSNVWLLGIKQHTVINTKDNNNLFSSGQQTLLF